MARLRARHGNPVAAMARNFDSNVEYYSSHGPTSDPGRFAEFLLELPSEVPELCACIQGLLVHLFMPPRRRSSVPRKQLGEMRARYVCRMLAILKDKQSSSLRVPRSRDDEKLAANCRDYATLLCSALREKGVPARVRFGFAKYFGPDFSDHVVCEYWSSGRRRWIFADAQLDKAHRNWYTIGFAAADVPRDQFLLAGEAWLLYRAGRLDPESVGLDSRLRVRGLSFVTSALAKDLVALDKVEPLCSDSSLIGDAAELGQSEESFLDEIAHLTTRRMVQVRRVRDLLRSRTLITGRRL